MKTKVCNKCKLNRSIEEFGLRASGAGGHRRSGICKPCTQLTHTCWRHGISIDEYNAMHKKQKGRCLICRRKCPSGRALAIDHDHATGRIRGLLCLHCNQGLGHFQDNPKLLARAIAYLK